MKAIMKGLGLALLASAVFLVGCAGAETPKVVDTTVKVSAIDATYTGPWNNGNLVYGSDPVKLAYVVSPANANNKAVTVSSSNTSALVVENDGSLTISPQTANTALTEGSLYITPADGGTVYVAPWKIVAQKISLSFTEVSREQLGAYYIPQSPLPYFTGLKIVMRVKNTSNIPVLVSGGQMKLYLNSFETGASTSALNSLSTAATSPVRLDIGASVDVTLSSSFDASVKSPALDHGGLEITVTDRYSTNAKTLSSDIWLNY